MITVRSVMDYFIVLSLLPVLLSTEGVRGDYVLRVQVEAFNNEEDTCVQCDSCCDADILQCTVLVSNCDNEFFFCVRPLGTNVTTVFDFNQREVEARATELSCLQPPGALRSEENLNSAPIDFSSSSFLGLSNPLEFEVSASMWKGIQLYVDVLDIDPQSNELIDILAIDIPSIGTDALQPGRIPSQLNVTGVFTIASLTVQLQVVCQPGFRGESCQALTGCDGVVCGNGGTCVPDGASFACLCSSAYTGQLCQTRLNVSVDDGNVDDGSVDHDSLDTAMGVICGSNGICMHSGGDVDARENVVGVALGGVVGGVVLVVIFVGIAVIVAVVCVHFVRQGQSAGRHVITTPEGATYSGNHHPSDRHQSENQTTPFERIPSSDSTAINYVNFDLHDDSQGTTTEAPPINDYIAPITTRITDTPKPEEEVLMPEEEEEDLYDTVSSLNRVRTFITPQAFVKRLAPAEDTPLMSGGNETDDGGLYEVMAPLQQLPPNEGDREHLSDPELTEDMYVCVNEY